MHEYLELLQYTQIINTNSYSHYVQSLKKKKRQSRVEKCFVRTSLPAWQINTAVIHSSDLEEEEAV